MDLSLCFYHDLTAISIPLARIWTPTGGNRFCSRETFSRQGKTANEIRGYNPAAALRNAYTLSESDFRGCV
jgi:hypothetical protein